MGCSQSKPADVATPVANANLETAASLAVENKTHEEPVATATPCTKEEDDLVKDVPGLLEPVKSNQVPRTTEQVPNSSVVDVPDSVRANFSSFNISFIDPTVSAPTSVSTESNVASTRMAVISEPESTCSAPISVREPKNVEEKDMEKVAGEEGTGKEGGAGPVVETKMEIVETAECLVDKVDEPKIKESSKEKVEETEAGEKERVEVIAEVCEVKTEEASVQPVVAKADETVADDGKDLIVAEITATTETPVVTSKVEDSSETQSKGSEEVKPINSDVEEASAIKVDVVEEVEKEAAFVETLDVKTGDGPAATSVKEEHAAAMEESVKDGEHDLDQPVGHTIEEEIVDLVEKQIVESIVKSSEENGDEKTVDPTEKANLSMETSAEQVDEVTSSYNCESEDGKNRGIVEIKNEDLAEKPVAVEQTMKHSDVVKKSVEEPQKKADSTDNQTEVEPESMPTAENESDSTLSNDDAKVEETGLKPPNKAKPVKKTRKAKKPKGKKTARGKV